MLVQLAIRDIVLIDRLELQFREGLSVLTGETGAGKSILLDAFALALGARGDGGLVRHGAPQGQVTAVFELARGRSALRSSRSMASMTSARSSIRSPIARSSTPSAGCRPRPRRSLRRRRGCV